MSILIQDQKKEIVQKCILQSIQNIEENISFSKLKETPPTKRDFIPLFFLEVYIPSFI